MGHNSKPNCIFVLHLGSQCSSCEVSLQLFDLTWTGYYISYSIIYIQPYNMVFTEILCISLTYSFQMIGNVYLDTLCKRSYHSP